eukprot:gb/GECG01008630.1/.p1 GENE.gb/GECG01008630.1/~~gb/GECG01008630.1/.p1  ORF type:complete len:348 (+),score=44.47 gb/GECG01008630.1/:1-1044(+)
MTPVVGSKKLREHSTKKGVTPITFLAPNDDFYRKPRHGMWLLLEGACLKGARLHRDNSFFVGDAAGRVGDHSSSDLDFAKNTGLQFIPPEALFGKDVALGTVMKQLQAREHLKDFTNHQAMKMIEDCQLFSEKFQEFSMFWNEWNGQCAIMLVGSPASGKTTFAKEVLESNLGIVRICQDELKNKQKCMKNAQQALNEGKSVVVDATNKDRSTRADWISLFDSFKSRGSSLCKVVITIGASKDQCLRLNLLRKLRPAKRAKFFTGSMEEVQQDTDEGRSVPAVVTHSHFKQYEEPTLEEGFDKLFSFPLAFNLWDEKLDKLKGPSLDVEYVHKHEELVRFFLSLMHV